MKPCITKDNNNHDVLIMGAGFAGIAMAAELKKAGVARFVVLEAESGIGGTWWLNRYPGCGCDVQSHLYSLSGAPNAHWSSEFAKRAEIQRYLEDIAQTQGLWPHIQLNCRVASARWDETANGWRVVDSTGQSHHSRCLVSAVGGLARPRTPDIPGLETFAGQTVHSQRWPDTLDVGGQRVGVIGTGASAVQFIPPVAQKAKHLTVFQRTPNWVLPKPDHPIRPIWQRLYQHVPVFRYLKRLRLFLLLETRLPAFTRWPKLSFFHRRRALRHLRQSIQDPKLQHKLVPDYAMGCKRVLMSNDYYPALARPNVALITDPIERVTSDGIVDQTGHHHALDVLILGTGFEATAPVPHGLVVGRHGQDLASVWDDGPSAYKGTTVSGFPNFFTLLGPNTALGHNSVLLMIEGQVRYVMAALKTMQDKRLQSIEVKDEAQQHWQRKLDQKLERAVWSQGGCQSWYLHPKSQRNTTLWPATTITFKHHTKRFDAAAYRCK